MNVNNKITKPKITSQLTILENYFRSYFLMKLEEFEFRITLKIFEYLKQKEYFKIFMNE